MINRLIILVSFLIINSIVAYSQPFPTDYFVPPLNGVLQLSGTFAELRGNHFHSGIDLRTNSKEGMPVRAIADGYVVRIKISHIGFGKAIYINHPNGYTSVYAHMQGFEERISDWVRARQYEKESFDVDLFPPKNQLWVKQGEIIGKSGNSGSSEGPHLHFEIRETTTELPVDPLLFGLPVKDYIRPTLHGLRIYPEGHEASVNESADPVSLDLAGWGPVYRLKINDTITIAGKYSLGVSASDLLNETSNRNGVTQYEVYIDSVLMFNWKAVKFSFNETRYINSFIDYSYYYNTNRRYMRTHIDPGNKSSMYKFQPSGGIFNVNPGQVQNVKIVIRDSKENESILRFMVKGIEINNRDNSLRAEISKLPLAPGKSGRDANKKGLVFSYNKLNNHATPNMRISMPGSCLYDSIMFKYSEAPGGPGMLASIHTIHTPEVPLQDYYELIVKVNEDYKGNTSKLIMVRLNSSNKAGSVGGVYENGFIKAKLRDFGRYSVMADTTLPVIKPVNIKEGQTITNLDEIRINISDNLSGIKSYRATLNDSWILMDYDAKNRLLVYKRDALLLQGKNIFSLTVTDGVGNTTTSTLMLMN